MYSTSQPVINAFRLRRSHLIDRKTISPALIARDLCGAQAQVLSAGMLSIGIRSGATKSEMEWVQKRNGSLVKTWAMRGTLHLLASNDLSLYVAALGANVRDRRIAAMMEEGVKSKDAERMLDVLAAALSSSALSRKQLSAIAAGQLGPWVKPWIENSWGGAMSALCRMGVAVFGPSTGAETTFVRREFWVKSWKNYSVEDAQDEIARRYFKTYGPATVSDFTFWLGAKAPVARAIVARIMPELVDVSVDNRTMLLLKKDLRELRITQPVTNHLRLLPHFDVYLLAHRRKHHLVSEKHYKKIYRTAGWISPTMLVNGEVAGTWGLNKNTNRVKVERHGVMAAGMREMIDAEARRIKEYFQ